MFLKRWKSLWNPDMYHGWGRSKNYFEGWYFKLVDNSETHALAVIPGISMDEAGNKHAFIQVLDGKNCLSQYHRFNANDFWASDKEFSVRIGQNTFSADGLTLDLPELKGAIRFADLTPWPKHLNAPGIMGWYSFVPFMECYHGVVSLNHSLEGKVKWKNQNIDFSNGVGYLEKDWGRSFPNSWIWAQTNHFDKKQVSMMCSVARIPWLGSSFIGLIAGVLVDGKIYRFATYTGAKILRTSISDKEVLMEFKTKTKGLIVSVLKGDSAELITPSSGEMIGKVNESMQATTKVLLEENGKVLFEGVGRNTGLEIGGAYEELIV